VHDVVLHQRDDHEPAAIRQRTDLERDPDHRQQPASGGRHRQREREQGSGRTRVRPPHPTSVPPISVYRISVYRISVYRISAYRISVYRISVYRISVYRISVYRISVYRISVYRISGTDYQLDGTARREHKHEERPGERAGDTAGAEVDGPARAGPARKYAAAASGLGRRRCGRGR